eukprot:CAMPEP_0201908604 /NCGR_PEP_ID=MMETSP0903-20130614/669_1 /ASSEMBLY_ACC=CAM_ASM_000552 /TAXON_ID=420261 /ORGANISM="Thalassiosira antarctica, Strain CCMP982" /LENGTH=646 /DNA_ID=CAMNT_0048442989 /DNA_START=76 /DNA_END=2016 /DNA_ORIENTATION=+
MNIRNLLLLLFSQLWIMVSSRTRIIGGGRAEPGRFPYAVSFKDNLGHFCGGSLISRDVVLSAAHCDIYQNKAVIGRHDLNTDEGEEMKVASTLRHPEYNDITTNNDIMLVFLEEPTDQSAEFVKLNYDASSPEISAPVTVAGWGLTGVAESSVSDVLMTVEVNTISNEECEQSDGLIGGWPASYDGKITDNMLCAKDDGEDSCQGDSGGPLVLQGLDGSADVQVGVVSWGFGCANKDFPGVYTRVSSAYDWIREEVCMRSLHPPAEFECDDLPTKAPVITPSPTPFPSYTPTGTTPLTTYPPTTTRPTRYPVTPCTDNTPGWVDVDGYGCEWWEVNDSPGCPLYGDEYEGTMGVANNNCCYCIDETHMPTSRPTEDGIATPEPTSSPTEGDVATLDPTSSPTEDNLSTLEPTSSPVEDGIAKSPTSPTQLCTDTLNWMDAWGHGCDWYRSTDDPGCPTHENILLAIFEVFTGSAIDNCCYCNGETPMQTSSPIEDGLATPEPTSSSAEDDLAVPEPTTSPTEDDIATPGPSSSPTEDVLAPLEPTSSPTEDDLATLEPTLQPASAEETLTPTLQQDSPTKQPMTEDKNSTPDPPLICTDTPDWEDASGGICEWYETNDFPGCPIFGNSYEGAFGLANDNCCHCVTD